MSNGGTPTGNPASILVALILAGLLGMLGQGVRAIAGLKKMNDSTTQDASSADLFTAARLIVSLLIGFLAGVAAGLALGLDKLLGINSSSINLMLGIAAAGYAGTDFIESFAPTIASKTPPAPTAPKQLAAAAQFAPLLVTASPQVVQPQFVTVGAFNVKYGVTFGSLVPNGFFSANPDDLNVQRSIRTNNPGALNFAPWQRSRQGFVGVTQPDNSPNHNVTTIYRTPEHGVAAWYHLLARLYNFPGGNFSLNDLAARYAGSNDAAAIREYIVGWERWLNPQIAPTAQISVTDTASLLNLARAMFSHEAGVMTPLHDDQITFAIEQEVAGTLPA